MTLAEAAQLLQQLSDRVDALEARIGGVEDKTKVERKVAQIVFDREGEAVKVRALIRVKTPTGIEERWEDMTDRFVTQATEVLNGA